jgi:hypothetical protein
MPTSAARELPNGSDDSLGTFQRAAQRLKGNAGLYNLIEDMGRVLDELRAGLHAQDEKIDRLMLHLGVPELDD